MIEQLVSGQIPISSLFQEVSSPPVSDSEIASQKMGRFDMPFLNEWNGSRLNFAISERRLLRKKSSLTNLK